MSAAEIAHFLKDCGNGDELTGVFNIFHAGVVAGAGGMIIIGTASYGLLRLGKWASKKINQSISKSNQREPALPECV